MALLAALKILVVIFIGFYFLACGRGSLVMQDHEMVNATLEKQNIELVTPVESIKVGTSFKVEVGKFLREEDGSFLWDHSFSDPSTYCQQSTGLGGKSATFNCPISGTLTLKLSFFPQGDYSKEQIYTRELILGDYGTLELPSEEIRASELDPLILGAQLYETRCLGCHGANGKRDRSVSQIRNALDNVASMRGLGDLSAQEIENISAYLNN